MTDAMGDSHHSTQIRLICEDEGKRTEGYANRYDLSKGARIVRALKMLGIFWFVMILTVFVPVLHFVLVPLFLLLGLILATTTYLETGIVSDGQINCPNCQGHIVFENEVENWPRVQRCPHCSFTLKIQKQGELG